MSLATVHYLSMNVRNGKVAPAGTVTATVNASFNLTGLNPETLYSVNWGDGGAQGAVTTAAVNNKARTGSTATLTTAAAHNFIVGQTVTIAGVDAALNGTYVLITGTTGSTLVYTTSTSGAISSTPVSPTGTASIPLTDANGAVTKTHTYASAGTYSVQIIDATTSQVAAKATVTVV